MMDVKTKVPIEPVEPRRSCKGCAHVSVCQIFRVEQEYLQKEFLDKGVQVPFKADELAALCKYFLPLSAVRLSTSPVEEADEK